MVIRKYDAMGIARVAAIVGAATTLSACSVGDQSSSGGDWDQPSTTEASSVTEALTRAIPGDYDGDGKAILPCIGRRM